MNVRVPVSRIGKKFALVVEDNPAFLKLVQRFLDSLGYAAMTAADGGEALAIIKDRTEAIDILVSDIQLQAELTGPELAREAKALVPSLKVLFISGAATTVLERSPEYDNHFLLSKPFTKSQFASALEAALQQD